MLILFAGTNETSALRALQAGIWKIMASCAMLFSELRMPSSEKFFSQIVSRLKSFLKSILNSGLERIFVSFHMVVSY